MGREVISKNDVAILRERLQELAELRQKLGAVAGGAPPVPDVTEDKYQDRLLKYIPADVIAIYLTLQGFVAMLRDPAPIRALHWVVFAIILIITIPWQRKVAKIGKWAQVWVGTGAFSVWAITVGDPFTATNLGGWYQSAYGAMILALYTFLIPLWEIA
jgi:hypothetical protein